MAKAKQVTFPGMGPSAVQAQAARDQQFRGGINPRGPVKPLDFGLFAPVEDRGPALPLALPASASQGGAGRR